jgi:hypothetical protein
MQQDSVRCISVHSPAINTYRRSDDADDGRRGFDADASACVPFRPGTLSAHWGVYRFPCASDMPSCRPGRPRRTPITPLQSYQTGGYRRRVAWGQGVGGLTMPTPAPNLPRLLAAYKCRYVGVACGSPGANESVSAAEAEAFEVTTRGRTVRFGVVQK